MEWITALKKAIDFMEANLCNDISADDVAKEVCISSFYLQKGFAIVTGFSLMEYVRNRRLYNAAQDILKNEEKIIDIAYKYCYETPESFTKAFSRFHGITPREVCKNPSSIKTFVPLKIIISIKGGFTMDKLEFTTEVLDEFTVIGFEKEFAFDQGYNLIPKYWDEINKISMPVLFYGKKPETDIEKAICENGIGQFGVCIDDLGANRFKYMIAGHYKGGPVPEGMKLFTFPKLEWAKFKCFGPLPTALQDLNTKIFREWLPGNAEYEMSAGFNIEYYTKGENGPNYESGIWFPIKKK